MSKTPIRKEVDKGIADKLLLSEASVWDISKSLGRRFRELHKNHRFQLVECFVVAFVLGAVLAGVV